MENNKNDSVKQYSDLMETVENHRILAENALQSSRLVLHALYDLIGNEPFEVNGREVSILVRRGTIQVMPTKRPRKAKEGITIATAIDTTIVSE